MFVASLSRQEFVDLFRDSHSIRVEETASPASALRLRDRSEIGCVWTDRHSVAAGLPSAVVIPQDEHRDFLAWCSSYLAPLSPITALSRLVDLDLVEDFDDSRSPEIGRAEGPFVGAILGEAFALQRLGERSASPGLASCMSTFSYALARCVAAGYRHSLLDSLPRRWTFCSDIVEDGVRPLDAVELDLHHQFLLGIHRFNEDRSGPSRAALPRGLQGACLDLAKKGELSRATARRLGLGLVDSRDSSALNREERFLAFQRYGEALSANRAEREVHSFCLGYLANSISPGSFNHIDLLIPYLQSFKTAAVWYGICAGFGSRRTLLASAEGLGWRVLRELLHWDRLWERPRSDISIGELEVWPDTLKTIRTNISGLLNVEVLPTCSVLFRRADVMRLNPSGQQIEMFQPSHPGRPLALLANLRRDIDDLESMLKGAPPLRRDTRGRSD